MKSKREYIDEWFNELKRIVLSNIDTDKYAVFLFGSAVDRDYPFGDVDIGILGEEPVPLRKLADISFELEESIVPFRHDFVDFSDVDKRFKDKVFSNKIEIWNKPKNIEIN
ncbi:MAG: nucleotidyltransferase domain-containing protein [Ignavibacteria bacterium]|nr:nucleotidyltransferase domain-containing protein [Ignavibacteria bacterium]